MAEQRITRLILGSTAERERALRHELVRRTGRRGAIRELFGANEHSPTTAEAAVPVLPRLFFRARRIYNGFARTVDGARVVARRLVAPLRAVSRDRAPSAGSRISDNQKSRDGSDARRA